MFDYIEGSSIMNRSKKELYSLINQLEIHQGVTIPGTAKEIVEELKSKYGLTIQEKDFNQNRQTLYYIKDENDLLAVGNEITLIEIYCRYYLLRKATNNDNSETD